MANKTLNILVVTEELKRVCGVSNHIKNLVNGFSGSNCNIIILCGNVEEEILKDYKCRILVNPRLLHSRRKISSFLKSVLFVEKIVKTYNIDIIHSHTHYAANIAHKAAYIKSVKTIQTNHGILENTGKLKHFKADHYIVLSERIKKHLNSEAGISGKAISVINQSVSDEYLTEVKQNADRLVIFSASRFTKDKSMDVYIKAANRIKKSYPGRCEFYISGEGELEKELKDLNAAEGGAVNFVDSGQGYKLMLKKAHIFVFNSLHEGIPIVLLEALFSGCFILTSAYEGYKDVFTTYDIPAYEPGNHQDLETLLESVILNYEINDEYIKFLKEVRNKYSLSEMIRKHNELYKITGKLNS